MSNNYKEELCPVCGYYCLGKGGFGCIDKPTLIRSEVNRMFINSLEPIGSIEKEWEKQEK